jgi:hypothetical protein
MRDALICNECEESQAFPKDIIELESSLGIPREELMADMEKGKRCILCGSLLEQGSLARRSAVCRVLEPLSKYDLRR